MSGINLLTSCGSRCIWIHILVHFPTTIKIWKWHVFAKKSYENVIISYTSCNWSLSNDQISSDIMAFSVHTDWTLRLVQGESYSNFLWGVPCVLNCLNVRSCSMNESWLSSQLNGTKTLHRGFAKCASLTNSVVGEAYAQGLPQMWCISWLELDYGPRNLAAIFSPLITYIYHISSVISVISHRNHCRHVSASHSGCRIEVHVQVSGANCLIWRHSEPRK